MRQGQQNRRGRGRGNNNNNNNRKGQNPLTRSFESNGPDMKIRGTPAHVAEKYMSLARDALSFGDPVLAENYLQHAEHYNRIILTFREQQAQNQADGANGSQQSRQRNQPNGPPRDSHRNRDNTAQRPQAGAPIQSDVPQPDVHSDDAPRERSGRSPRSSRSPRTSTQRSPARATSQNGTSSQKDAPHDDDAPRRQSATGRQRDGFGDGDEQPQFLRRPVRRSKSEAVEDAGSKASTPVAADPVGDDRQD